ncbi:MAG: hypothetical protein J6X98_08860, partial [Bacteroidales bacterium]|nr:hypothetical protein [Bacteroidales bacterium]
IVIGLRVYCQRAEVPLDAFASHGMTVPRQRGAGEKEGRRRKSVWQRSTPIRRPSFSLFAPAAVRHSAANAVSGRNLQRNKTICTTFADEQ